MSSRGTTYFIATEFIPLNEIEIRCEDVIRQLATDELKNKLKKFKARAYS